MLRFSVIICDYAGGSHVAAPILVLNSRILLLRGSQLLRLSVTVVFVRSTPRDLRYDVTH